MIRTPRWAVVALVLGLALAATACGEAADPYRADEPGTPASAEPTAAAGGTVQGAPAPDGGLTVGEALASDLDGPLTVRGFLIEVDGTTRLCEASLESMPPQCGEPSLLVQGVRISEVGGATTAQDVTWVDQASLTGSLQDGVLQVSSTTS